MRATAISIPWTDMTLSLIHILSFCGDDMGGGQVRFQEKYGFNFYRMEEGMVRMCRSETYANGRILGTLTF